MLVDLMAENYVEKCGQLMKSVTFKELFESHLGESRNIHPPKVTRYFELSKRVAQEKSERKQHSNFGPGTITIYVRRDG